MSYSTDYLQGLNRAVQILLEIAAEHEENFNQTQDPRDKIKAADARRNAEFVFDEIYNIELEKAMSVENNEEGD